MRCGTHTYVLGGGPFGLESVHLATGISDNQDCMSRLVNLNSGNGCNSASDARDMEVTKQ